MFEKNAAKSFYPHCECICRKKKDVWDFVVLRFAGWRERTDVQMSKYADVRMSKCADE